MMMILMIVIAVIVAFETKNYIKFYKGYILVEIHELFKQIGYTKNETDKMLKKFAQVEKSCTKMDYFEIMELIISSFQFGDMLGLNLDFKSYD